MYAVLWLMRSINLNSGQRKPLSGEMGKRHGMRALAQETVEPVCSGAGVKYVCPRDKDKWGLVLRDLRCREGNGKPLVEALSRGGGGRLHFVEEFLGCCAENDWKEVKAAPGT